MAVELITHTFDITMAVFDVSQSVVRQAGGLIQGSTAIDADALQTMQATLEAMELGSLLGIFLQSFIVQFLMYVLAAVIFVIINGRMVEIYLMVSLAPIPFATFGNREQSMMGRGSNYQMMKMIKVKKAVAAKITGASFAGSNSFSRYHAGSGICPE